MVEFEGGKDASGGSFCIEDRDVHFPPQAILACPRQFDGATDALNLQVLREALCEVLEPRR